MGHTGHMQGILPSPQESLRLVPPMALIRLFPKWGGEFSESRDPPVGRLDREAWCGHAPVARGWNRPMASTASSNSIGVIDYPVTFLLLLFQWSLIAW